MVLYVGGQRLLPMPTVDTKGTGYKLEATEVKTFKVRMVCKRCDSEMRAGNWSLGTLPEQHVHVCTNKECGATSAAVTRYPALMFRAAGDESLLENPLCR